MSETHDPVHAPRRFHGKYRGIVFDNNDPKKLGRLKLTVPEVFGNSIKTDWATPVLPYGGVFDTGFFTIPENNSGVWVVFEAGDPNRPMWTGTWWSEPTGESEVPRRARGLRNVAIDEIDVGGLEGSSLEFRDRAVMEATGKIRPPALVFKEPPSQYGGIYPHVKILKTASGHSIELDDTRNVERIRIYHKSGSYEEFRVGGSVTRKSLANLGEYVGSNKTELIQGNSTKVVAGKTDNTLKGDVKIVVGGTYKHEVIKDVETTFVNNHFGYVGGDRNFHIVGGLTYQVNSSIVLSTGSNMQLVTRSSFEQSIGGTWRGVIANSNVPPDSEGLVLDVRTGDIKISTNGNMALAPIISSNIELSTGQGDINLTTLIGDIVLDVLVGTQLVKLGGTSATQSVVLGDLFKVVFDTHFHLSGAPGLASTPPTIPMPSSVLSTTVKSAL